MPELPEVETIVRQLRNKLIGQIIWKVKILRPSQWKATTANRVRRKLKNKKIMSVNRRAKFIIFNFDDSSQLVIHLRMTGKLIWSEKNSVMDDYARTIFSFASGACLSFNDTRALGALELFEGAQKNTWQKKLGIEPLSENWNVAELKKITSTSKLDIKSFLLDQTKIAGVGNIYANEILFLSDIHPERRANTLTEKEVGQLYQNIPQVLQLAIDKMGTSLGHGKQNFRSLNNMEGGFQDMIRVYDRENEPCVKCGSPIIRIKQKGRSSYFCRVCQK